MHEGGVTVQALIDGTLRFTTKDGRSFESPLPERLGAERGPRAADILQGDWAQLFTDENGDVVITADTAITRWRGERMDYGIAVEALLHRSAQQAHVTGEAHADVSAETPTGSCVH